MSDLHYNSDPSTEDTIVAISTPPGRGGIGIVRLSGPASPTIAEPLLKLRHPLAPAQARFAEILDSTGETLDEAVVTYFAAPHSYTSEDIVEIAAHGSPVLLDHLLRQCIAAGARLAEPGEFTQRAFLSGRLDLTQAEAVHDLIESTTLHQARIAAQQLGGSLSRQIYPNKTTTYSPHRRPRSRHRLRRRRHRPPPASRNHHRKSPQFKPPSTHSSKPSPMAASSATASRSPS